MLNHPLLRFPSSFTSADFGEETQRTASGQKTGWNFSWEKSSGSDSREFSFSNPELIYCFHSAVLRHRGRSRNPVLCISAPTVKLSWAMIGAHNSPTQNSTASSCSCLSMILRWTGVPKCASCSGCSLKGLDVAGSLSSKLWLHCFRPGTLIPVPIYFVFRLGCICWFDCVVLFVNSPISWLLCRSCFFYCLFFTVFFHLFLHFCYILDGFGLKCYLWCFFLGFHLLEYFFPLLLNVFFNFLIVFFQIFDGLLLWDWFIFISSCSCVFSE